MQRLPGLEVKAADVSSDGTFSGYGAVFGEVDAYSDIIEPGAFKGSLERNSRPKMLRGHDQDRIIGKWDALSEDATGLRVEGKIFLDNPDGAATHALMMKGELDGLSIGFRTLEADYRETEDDFIRVIKSVDLWEISVVTFPAMANARIEDVKSLLDGNGAGLKRSTERFLRDAGFTLTEAKAMAGAASSKLFEMRDASDPAEMVAALAELNSMIKGS